MSDFDAAWAAHGHVASRLEPARPGDWAKMNRGLARRKHGIVSSHKINQAIAWRNRNDRDLFLLLEADCAVRHFEPYPDKLSLIIDGRPRTHMPSVRVRTAEGRVTMDVFSSLDSKTPIGRFAAQVAHVYAENGLAYQAVTPADIRLEPRFSNAMHVVRHRRFRTRPEVERHVVQSISDGRRKTVADIARELAHEADAAATVFSLALSGMLRLDLSAAKPQDMQVSFSGEMLG